MLKKIILISFSLLTLMLCGMIESCDRSVSPMCWGKKQKGTLFYMPNCPANELTALLVVDDNPSDTLQVRNSIPKKFQKASIRVMVRYKEVSVSFTTQQCVGYSRKFVKITCIEEE